MTIDMKQVIAKWHSERVARQKSSNSSSNSTKKVIRERIVNWGSLSEGTRRNVAKKYSEKGLTINSSGQVSKLRNTSAFSPKNANIKNWNELSNEERKAYLNRFRNPQKWEKIVNSWNRNRSSKEQRTSNLRRTDVNAQNFLLKGSPAFQAKAAIAGENINKNKGVSESAISTFSGLYASQIGLGTAEEIIENEKKKKLSSTKSKYTPNAMISKEKKPSFLKALLFSRKEKQEYERYIRAKKMEYGILGEDAQSVFIGAEEGVYRTLSWNPISLAIHTFGKKPKPIVTTEEAQRIASRGYTNPLAEVTSYAVQFAALEGISKGIASLATPKSSIRITGYVGENQKIGQNTVQTIAHKSKIYLGKKTYDVTGGTINIGRNIGEYQQSISKSLSKVVGGSDDYYRVTSYSRNIIRSKNNFFIGGSRGVSLTGSKAIQSGHISFGRLTKQGGEYYSFIFKGKEYSPSIMKSAAKLKPSKLTFSEASTGRYLVNNDKFIGGEVASKGKFRDAINRLFGFFRKEKIDSNKLSNNLAGSSTKTITSGKNNIITSQITKELKTIASGLRETAITEKTTNILRTTSPIILSKQKTNYKQIPIVKQSENKRVLSQNKHILFKQAQKPIVTTKIASKQKYERKTATKHETAKKTEQIPKLTKTRVQQQEQINKPIIPLPTAIQYSYMPKVPIIPPITQIPRPILTSQNRKTSRTSYSNKKYKPSIVGIEFQYYSTKKPTLVTGIGIRPIIKKNKTKKTPKKNKKKKKR